MSFARNLSNKYDKKLLDTAPKTRLTALKTSSKWLIHKTAEVVGEFFGKKIAEKHLKLQPIYDTNPRDVEEIGIPLEKRKDILTQSGQVLQNKTLQN